jgi:hypothetical protein
MAMCAINQSINQSIKPQRSRRLGRGRQAVSLSAGESVGTCRESSGCRVHSGTPSSVGPHTARTGTRQLSIQFNSIQQFNSINIFSLPFFLQVKRLTFPLAEALYKLSSTKINFNYDEDFLFTGPENHVWS